jgi:hypothetical protein
MDKEEKFAIKVLNKTILKRKKIFIKDPITGKK